MFIEHNKQYKPALQAVEGFSHLNLIWWFSEFDKNEYREILQTSQSYPKAPEVMVNFATRLSVRPNSIALSTIKVMNIDYEKALIKIAYVDANVGSPILDTKPYTPSMYSIQNPQVPAWCAYCPKSYEKSEDFDRENEFLF